PPDQASPKGSMSWVGTSPAVLALTLQCLDGSGMSSGPVFWQKIGRLARWDLTEVFDFTGLALLQ
ncbi:MAG: hypothetical protein ACXU95_14570, partial [Isosphaeraceae bacterium]